MFRRDAATRWLLPLLLLVLSVGMARANFNPIYARDHVNFFPVAAATTGGAVTLDGKLDEWKPGAFVTLYPDPDLLDTFALRVAFAYDDNGLLLAGRFTDRSPLINHIDPAVDPFSGWDGDALQLRVISGKLKRPYPTDQLNSNAIAHLTLWYFTDKRQPALDIRYGMDFHGAKTLIGAESGLAFAAGQNTWTVEGRIPWALLNVETAPRPGDTWNFTLQTLFGNAAGKLQHNFFECISSPGFHFQRPDGWGLGYFVKPEEVEARFTAQADFLARRLAREKGDDPTAPTLPITYENPAAGFVSLAICKPDGQIVRTLLAKQQRDGGRVTELWNGLDDDGNPVPAGTYNLKALTHPGITGRHIVSVHNSGQPAWVNADDTGGWGGDHAPPVDVASSPDGYSYLMWTFNEGGNFLIRVDATGRKSWGADIPWGDYNGGATALVYDRQPDGKGILYAAKDGVGKDKGWGGLLAFAAETGKRVNFPNGKGILTFTEWDPALLKGTGETGTPQERMMGGKYSPADLEANLVGLAASPTRLFAAFYLENKIVAYDKATFTAKETYAVPRPAALEYDAARNRLLAVSEGRVVSIALATGAVASFVSDVQYPFGLALDAAGNLYVSVRGRQMQVRVYAATGKLLRAIGKTGGRAWEGKYDPSGMLMPAGISVDSKNQLWVTEMDVTPKRQSLWNAKNGKLIKEFFGSAAYAPMMAPDPEKPEEVYIHNTRFLVDYQQGTVRPDATIYRAGLHGPSLQGAQAGYGFMGATFEIQRIGKAKYAFDGHGGVYTIEKDRFKPLCYLGQGQSGMPGLPANQPPHYCSVVWKDLNHNGLFDAGEVTVLKQNLGLYNNIAQFGATFYPGGAMIKGGRLFRPAGIDTDGFPVYPDPTAAEPIITGNGPAKQLSWCIDVWPSFQSDWNDYYFIGAPIHEAYAADKFNPQGIYRIARDGSIRWRYARVVANFGLKAPLAKDGDLFGAIRILGEVELPKAQGGEIVGIGVYRGYYAFLTEDGLYVDRFGHENGRGPLPDYDTFFIENFSGYFFQHPRTKKIYLFGGTQEGRIIELNGWEKIRRFDPGTVTVTDDDYRKVVEAVRQRRAQDGLTVLPITAQTAVVDGAATEWHANALAVLELDETHQARLGLAGDQANLYALFDVADDSPWLNGSKDWRYLFKGGDYVDIHLGKAVAVSKDTPRQPQPGDVRVMIGPALDGGAPTVVAMWTRVLAGMAKEEMLYKSPVAQETFERVVRLDNTAVKVVQTAKGYLVEAAIPWAALGMTAPAKGTKLQGDLGVILSDRPGLQAIRRVYLFNKDTGVVNDIPSEVRVVCANWGTLTVE